MSISKSCHKRINMGKLVWCRLILIDPGSIQAVLHVAIIPTFFCYFTWNVVYVFISGLVLINIYTWKLSGLNLLDWSIINFQCQISLGPALLYDLNRMKLVLSKLSESLFAENHAATFNNSI